ncbi:MAG TPA: hypothetical protein VFQ40_01035 [Actinomycetota bacterium]|nr:hypothetical protein [Actinomycetota bacterium]
MDEQGGFPDRPDAVPTQRPTAAPARRRASWIGVIAVAVVTTVIAIALQATGGSDAPGDRPRKATILDEDFSDPLGDWVTGRNADRDIAYEDGRYRIRVTTPAFQQYSYSLFRLGQQDRLAIEVVAEHVDGTPDGFVGVVCPTDVEAERGYAFMVHPEEGQFLISEHDGSGWRPIRVARTQALLSNGPLRIRAECFGAVDGRTWLVMSIDGRVVLAASDRGTTSFRGVGLSVWSRDGGTEARFDDLSASRDVPYPAVEVGEASGADVLGTGDGADPGSVRMRDDFEDPGTGWFTANEPSHRFAYVDGSYGILVDRPFEYRYAFRELGGGFRSVGLSVVAGTARYRTPPGAAGPMCLSAGEEVTGYAFGLDQHAGTYMIIRIREGSQPVPIANGRSDAIMDSGFSNRIHATCAVRPGGAQVDLALSVNGNLVGEASDRRGVDRFTAAGLYAESDDGGTDILFDDLVVRAAR